ncbi:hypothetical protein J4216_05595 [Candidatus Woesearchaeota archaeon]|nr:hypothetical protein [Candidatus Woesearchaeota archaeon]
MPLKKSDMSTETQNSPKDIHELIKSVNQLTQRIDRLLTLFEQAAKHIDEVESTEAKISNLSSRLDSLLEQNKAIAQGLILLEKYVRGKTGLQKEMSQ